MYYLIFSIDSKMRVESIILDTEKNLIKSSILMVLPLNKGEKVLGFWFLTPKFDIATWQFLKSDMRHGT